MHNRLEKLGFRVVIEKTLLPPSHDPGLTRGTDTGTTTRYVALHPLFRRDRPWYLPFITYRQGVLFRPSKLFSLHSLASVEGLLEAIAAPVIH